MQRPAMHRLSSKAWISSASFAVALLSCLVVAASAQGAAPRLRYARCVEQGHTCAAVVPKGTLELGGSGFGRDMLVVFTIKQGRYVVNATRGANVLGPHRLRTHVPSNAVSGPVYLLAPTARSNAINLTIRSSSSGSCSSTPGAGNEITRWQPVALCVLGLLHQPQSASYVNDVMIIIRGESGGDPNAINNWDSNAAAGDPSRGLMQVIGATFKQYRDPALSNNIYDPAANIYAGLAYGIARYGSIPNIPGVKSVNSGGPYRGYKTAAP